MKRLSTVLLATFIAASLSFPAALPAGAQEAGETFDGEIEDDAAFTLEEITVTAEKSEQNLQKISRSMAVVSAEDLTIKANDNFMEALSNVGGVSFMGMWNHIYIRGVGHTTAEEGSEPGVQFNVDGAPALLIENATVSPMYQASNDVERIEIIRGPSGSVNGRSAAAGTVNVITKSPSFEKIDGNVSLTMGNYETLRLNAALNLPMKLSGLSLPSYLEDLSFRLAAAENKHGAYVKNSDGEDVSGLQNNQSFRAKMKWQPIDALSLNATFNYSRDASDMNMSVPALGGTPGVAGAATDPHEDDPWLNADAGEMTEPDVTRQYNTNYEAAYETGLGTITGRFSYSWVPVECDEDDQNCYEGNRGQKDFELRLNNPEDSWITWNIGGYYYNKKTYTGPDSALGDFDEDYEVDFYDFYGEENLYTNYTDIFDPTSSDADVNNTTTFPWTEITGLDEPVAGSIYTFQNTSADRPINSYSAFVNATIPLFENTHRLVLGFRKNFERKERSYSLGIFGVDPDAENYNNGYPHFTFEDEDGDGSGTWVCDNCTLVAQDGPNEMTTDDDPVTYTLGWEYDWMDEVMLYAQVSNGYKPGGISPNAVPNIFYEPEYLTNYAIGTKSRWFDQRLQLNGEIFYMDYENYQTNLANSNMFLTATIDGETYTGVGFQSVTVNFPRTQIYGFDLDYDVLITSKDRFNGTLEYKHSDYADFTYYLGPSSDDWKPLYAVFDNRRMPYAPRFTFTGNYSHIFNFRNFQATPRITAKYSSRYFLYTEYWMQEVNPEMWQPAYWKFDTYLNLGPQDSTWSINLYCKNVTNEPVRIMALMTNVMLDEPRTYGATFKVKF